MRCRLTGSSWARAAAALLAISAALADAAHGQAESELGTYERNALGDALRRTGLTVSAAPHGRFVGKIHVVNLDVFSERDGYLDIFNIFHLTTRDYVVEREVLLRPGQMWDQEVIDESARKLRDPIFTTLVVIVPVEPLSGKADEIDLLVVTRDVWSLRLNSEIEFQGEKLARLLIAPSENNFLGRRKLASMVFDMDLGEYEVGPLYLDKNVLGKRWQMQLSAAAVFGRETSDLEGESVGLSIVRPFWSLSSRWSGGLALSHRDDRFRSFEGAEVRTYTVPDDVEPCGGAQAPVNFPLRQQRLEYSASHQRGRAFKHRISAGHRVRIIDSSLPEDLPADPCLRENYERDELFPDETVSELFVQYRLFEPYYVQLRNVDSFDFAEDYRFGPSATAELASGLSAIGSDNNFVRGGLSATWTVALGADGFIGATVEAGGRLQGGELINNQVGGIAKMVTPTVGGWLRIVARTSATVRLADRQNVDFVLGGQNGLRGFAINQFRGKARLLGNLDLRTTPLELGFTRLGALLFFDIGDAPESLSETRLHANVGLGIRFLIPQMSNLVYRLDWAFPLEGEVLPGRFIFASGQAF